MREIKVNELKEGMTTAVDVFFRQRDSLSLKDIRLYRHLI